MFIGHLPSARSKQANVGSGVGKIDRGSERLSNRQSHTARKRAEAGFGFRHGVLSHPPSYAVLTASHQDSDLKEGKKLRGLVVSSFSPLFYRRAFKRHLLKCM